MALPRAITITELTGEERTVRLSGVDLPRQSSPMTFGGRVRGKTTWYAGSAVPTSQILGVEEMPMQFSGVFDERKRGIPFYAEIMVDLYDSIRRAGRHCRLEYGPWTRICRWEEFSWRPVELARIRYTMKFVVLHNDVGTRKRLDYQAIALFPTIGEYLNLLVFGLDLANSLSGVLQLDTVLGPFNSLANTGLQLADSLNDIGNLPSRKKKSKAREVLTQTRQSKQDGAQLITNLRQAAADDLSTTSEDTFARSRRQVSYAEIEATVSETLVELDRIERQARAAAAEADQATETLRVRDGQSLQRIALERYGTAGAVGSIMEDNRMLRWTISGGDVLSIKSPIARDKTAADPSAQV